MRPNTPGIVVDLCAKYNCKVTLAWFRPSEGIYFWKCQQIRVYLLFPFFLAKFHKTYLCIYSPRLGAGVVGIVNIPLEIMEPSHNKQDFLNVQEYNHLLKVMGQYLVQYCKDTGMSEYSMVRGGGASGGSACVISLSVNYCTVSGN